MTKSHADPNPKQVHVFFIEYVLQIKSVLQFQRVTLFIFSIFLFIVLLDVATHVSTFLCLSYINSNFRN